MKHQFQQFFNHDFSNYSEFLRQVLFPIFGEENFSIGYDILTQEPGLKQKAIDANIEEIKHVGTFSTDLAAEIKVFEVVVSDHCHINRSRIKIQTLIRSYVETFEGAFMIFHYKNTVNRSWRFSYVEKRSSLSDSTSAKRYTYLFGESYACRTAAQRFYELYKLQKNITLQNITETFSVEALSDEFFEKYRSLYADFIQFITGKRYEKEKGKWVEKVKHVPNIQFETSFENNDKAVRDYVKKMMGRLVFLQFLQKKGWLGVPADKPWGYGNINYLQQLFEKSNQKENFLEEVLEPLFFDTLNQERTNQMADRKLGENIKIPYLNGGLFEKDELDKKVVVFPAEYFNKLFDFFGEYNFTIDENDPNDAELGVDPEMLGRIFENLLEDNKDKGAYYTPKEIVHYMCQESLTEYLCTKLDIQDEIAERDAINQLLKNKIVKPILKPKIDDLEKALDQVKICDPAIGSGAFPMGLLQEIFSIKGLIAQETGKEWNPTETKLNIIQNSIYGVDIEKGAVDIARLRFWLSLLVDEETPKPLPNLDYKIMVGDSLVSKFEHTVIEIDWDKTMSVGEGDVHIKTMQKALRDISDKQKQFFDINNHNKKLILKTEIRNLKLDILIAQLSFNRAAFVNKNQIIMEMGFGLTTKDQKDNLEIKKNIKDFNDVIEKLETLKTNDKPFNHFDWTLDFPIELNPYLVTDSNQRGFDIVIANPPYIGQSGNRNLFQQVLQTNFGKTFHQRRMDYFYFFIHKAIRVAKHDTILSFITTNYFLNATYADKLRKDLFENCDFLKLINFNEAKIFESATGQHNAISILTKKKNINNYVETAITSHKGIISGKVIYDILYGNDALSKKFNFLTTNIFEPPKYHILIEGTGHEENYNNKASILNSIKDSSLRLIEVVDIVQGIVTGANDLSPKYKKDYSISEEEGSGIFVLQKKELENIKINSKEKTFIKPWYKNSDIQRWTCNEKTNQYLIYITSIDVIDESEIPNLINHFEPYKKLLINRNVRTGRYSLSDYNDFLKGSLDIPYVMIKSSFKKGHYYLVSYARDKYVFEGPKIICPQRSPINTFGYSLASWYGASDVYYIIEKKDKAYNLKYLLAILNSKLIYFWLYNKGQRKGQTLQLFKDPLSEIPIKHPLNSNFYIYSKIVDYILYLKKKTIININEELITPYFEQIINGMVYELYFPELLKKHNCQIIEYLGELPELNVEMSEEQKMEACKEVFDRLNDENHQVKINLEKMKEIKEIRIIEGLEN